MLQSPFSSLWPRIISSWVLTWRIDKSTKFLSIPLILQRKIIRFVFKFGGDNTLFLWSWRCFLNVGTIQTQKDIVLEQEVQQNRLRFRPGSRSVHQVWLPSHQLHSHQRPISTEWKWRFALLRHLFQQIGSTIVPITASALHLQLVRIDARRNGQARVPDPTFFQLDHDVS